MAEIQNYQINYTIDVKTNGIQDVTKFSEAINKLKISEKGAEAAITQVKKMVNKMDAIFKPKGRKRDVNYNVNVKTNVAKKKLEEILSLLGQIKGATNMTLGTNMVSPPAGSGSIAITPVVSNTVDSDKASPRSSIQRKVSANENKTIKEAERELKRLARESEKEFKRQDREYTNLWNKIEKEQEREYRDNIKKKLDNFRKLTKDMEEQQKRYEKYQEYVMANKLKMEGCKLNCVSKE